MGEAEPQEAEPEDNSWSGWMSKKTINVTKAVSNSTNAVSKAASNATSALGSWFGFGKKKETTPPENNTDTNLDRADNSVEEGEAENDGAFNESVEVGNVENPVEGGDSNGST